METNMTVDALGRSLEAKVASLESHLGYWLRYVSNHVSHAFARKLETRNVTMAEWVVMRQLYDTEEMSPSHLAERLGMSRGHISKLAERLIGKALIRRKHNPYDGRAQSLALTAAGSRLVPQLARLADQNDAEFFALVAPADRQGRWSASCGRSSSVAI
jgi:DNA-binding MarR family transcriptional regulator